MIDVKYDWWFSWNSISVIIKPKFVKCGMRFINFLIANNLFLCIFKTSAGWKALAVAALIMVVNIYVKPKDVFELFFNDTHRIWNSIYLSVGKITL